MSDCFPQILHQSLDLRLVIFAQQDGLNFVFSVVDMAPYYEVLCKELKWQVDSDLLSKMKKANEEELKRLDDVLEDAETNLGESEIRDAMMAKAEYLIRIGNKVRSPFFPGYIADMGTCFFPNQAI